MRRADLTVLATVLAVSLAMTACNDDDETRARTDSRNQAPVVKASEWVRNTTQIDGYRIDNGGLNTVDLTLLNASGNPLASLSVSTQSGHSNDDGTQGAIRGILKIDGKHALTLFTHGVALQDYGYASKMRLENNIDTVRLRAEHRYQSCYTPLTNQPTVPTAPDCASPLSLKADAYSLPSCGLLRYAAEDNGLSPQLTNLTYIQDAPLHATSAGARLFDSEGNVLQARLDVLTNGVAVDPATVNKWLADTGADTIIGTQAEHLLTAAFQDRAWRDFVQRQLLQEAAPAAGRSARLFTANNCSVFASRNASGLPPRAAKCFGFSWLSDLFGNLASALGDPHIYPFQTPSYDFQAHGEYTAARSTDGSRDLEIQTRLEPLLHPNTAAGPACSNVTYISAVAMRINGQRIGIYARQTPELTVDGMAVADAAAMAQALEPGVKLLTDGTEYTFILDNGSRIVIRRHNSTLALTLHMASDHFEGLLVPFMRPDGTMLATPPTFDQLYDDFGESWRVKTQAASLFDYPAGKSLADFHVAGFPGIPARVDALSPAARTSAEAKCADVVGEPAHTWCVLDTACTGQGFADLYMNRPPAEKTMTTAQRPLVVGGLLAAGQPDSVAADASFGSASCRLPGPTGNAVFAEQRGVKLTAPVVVDIDQPGAYTEPGQVSQSTLAAGTRVDVFMIHVPDPRAGRPINSVATVRFNGEILGVTLTPSSLHNTDNFGSGNGLAYPGAESGRGLELGNDRLTISPDSHELAISLGAPGDVDQLRVFVAVP